MRRAVIGKANEKNDDDAQHADDSGEEREGKRRELASPAMDRSDAEPCDETGKGQRDRQEPEPTTRRGGRFRIPSGLIHHERALEKRSRAAVELQRKEIAPEL